MFGKTVLQHRKVTKEAVELLQFCLCTQHPVTAEGELPLCLSSVPSALPSPLFRPHYMYKWPSFQIRGHAKAIKQMLDVPEIINSV